MDTKELTNIENFNKIENQKTKYVILSIIFNLISIISFYEINITGSPFLPEDLLLIGNATEIIGYANIEMNIVIVLQIFITIILLVIQLMITKYTNYDRGLQKKSRIIIVIISIIVLSVGLLFNWNGIRNFGEEILNLRINYYKYGAIVDFS